MKEENRIGLRIFLQFWGLLAVLAGFNIYNYTRLHTKLSLAGAIVCVAAFISWGLAYRFYFGRPSPRFEAGTGAEAAVEQEKQEDHGSG
jgi:hypothetical protein